MPVTLDMDDDKIEALLRSLHLAARQGICAYTGQAVNADALFTNLDAALDILQSCDNTGQFRRAREEFDAQRRQEALVKLSRR